MLRAIISTWTLFFGLLLINAGSGLQVVLLGTRAPEVGFSNFATSIVMSGWFAGIFIGSIIVPNTLPARLRTFLLTRIDLADEDQLALLLNASLDQVHSQLLNYCGIYKAK